MSMTEVSLPDAGPRARRIARRWRDPFAPEPWARRAVRVAPDLVRDEMVLARLQDAQFQSDPLADGVARYLTADRARAAERRALFERAVDHGIESLGADAPEPLCRLFAHIDEVPAWLDRARIARAKRVAHRVSFGGDYVLSCFGLLPGYLAIGTAKVLARTGALERLAARRLDETAHFVAGVYATGEIHRFSPAVKSAVRVRVMHALVRDQLLRSGTWDTDAYGVPINQFDMCGTNLLFSITFTLGLRGLGFVLSRQEREDVVHVWRYIGRLLGIAEDLIPTTEREGRRLLRLVGAAQQGPDDDARRLAAALLAATERRWHALGRAGRALGKLDTAFRAGLTRLYVGDAGADRLGLRDDAWRFAIAGVFPAVRMLELARRSLPFETSLAARLGERAVVRYLERALGGTPPSFLPYAMQQASAPQPS
jgi:hypothetical protein